MSDNSKIQPTHLARLALVYVRQSTTSQLERNQESTDRQYKLVERAIELGWSRDQITVIDEDLGCTGSGLVERVGFEGRFAVLEIAGAGGFKVDNAAVGIGGKTD